MKRPQRILLCLALLVALLLAACDPFGQVTTLPPPASSDGTPGAATANVATSSAGVPSGATVDRPIKTTGCGSVPPLATGTSADLTIPADPALANGATTRAYRLHLPAGYQPDKPLPLLLVFHGEGGTAAGEEQSSGFSQLADQEGFLAVYPQGLKLSGGQSGWASTGPSTGNGGVDDTRFVSDLLTALQHHYCVDAERVYAAGFAAGGGMVNDLACTLAGRIAAFALVAGDYYSLPGGCGPGRPVSILEIHGTADPTAPYKGLPAIIQRPQALPSIADWLRTWAAWDGCAPQPDTFIHQSGLTAERWTDCQNGSAVVHYRLDGAGHAWPKTLGKQSTAEVIWRFLAAHPLPAS